MKTETLTLVRVYLTESEHRARELPQLLKQTKPRHVMRSSVEALSPD